MKLWLLLGALAVSLVIDRQLFFAPSRLPAFCWIALAAMFAGLFLAVARGPGDWPALDGCVEMLRVAEHFFALSNKLYLLESRPIPHERFSRSFPFSRYRLALLLQA